MLQVALPRIKRMLAADECGPPLPPSSCLVKPVYTWSVCALDGPSAPLPSWHGIHGVLALAFLDSGGHLSPSFRVGLGALNQVLSTCNVTVARTLPPALVVCCLSWLPPSQAGQVFSPSSCLLRAPVRPGPLRTSLSHNCGYYDEIMLHHPPRLLLRPCPAAPARPP
jgi:hypothetical protein